MTADADQSAPTRLSELEHQHFLLRQQLYRALDALDRVITEGEGNKSLEAELARLQVLSVARDIREAGG